MGSILATPPLGLPRREQFMLAGEELPKFRKPLNRSVFPLPDHQLVAVTDECEPRLARPPLRPATVEPHHSQTPNSFGERSIIAEVAFPERGLAGRRRPIVVSANCGAGDPTLVDSQSHGQTEGFERMWRRGADADQRISRAKHKAASSGHRPWES